MGEVADLTWDFESKRIAVVGAGANKAKVFMYDTGTELGRIKALAKKANSCALRPRRPQRLMYGGEDGVILVYNGPPFRHQRDIRDHGKFVNCVRYAPSGELAVSVSSSKRALLHDGDTGEVMGELDRSAMHKSSLYSVDFSPDGARLVTSSADKCIKVWNVEDRSCTSTVRFGTTVDHMQNAVVWPRDDTIISVGLSGAMYVTEPGADGPSAVFEGHKEAVSCLARNPTTGQLITGDRGNRVCVWTASDEGSLHHHAAAVDGETHSRPVLSVATSGSTIYSVGMDDQLRVGDIETATFHTSVPTGAAPRCVAAAKNRPELCAVATGPALLVFRGGAEVGRVEVSYDPRTVCLSDDGSLLVSGGDDKLVHFYDIGEDGSIAERGVIGSPLNANVNALVVSPCGTMVAVGDAAREVAIFRTDDFSAVRRNQWTKHSARVTGILWNADSTRVVSVGMDCQVCVFDPSKMWSVANFERAHARPLIGVVWGEDEEHVWVCSMDGIVKRLSIV